MDASTGLRVVRHLPRFVPGCKCPRLTACGHRQRVTCRGAIRWSCSSSSGLGTSPVSHVVHPEVRCSSSLAQEFMRATHEHHRHSYVRKIFRCEENDPINHTKAHEGLFYTVPDNQVKQLFQGGLSSDFCSRMKAFQETCLMVRKPALEVLDMLRVANFDYPPLKFILYGERGTGKTVTIAHLLHYAACSGFLLVHVPWPAFWVMYAKESVISTHNPERRDLPLEALQWLSQFKSQNYKLLQQLKTTGTYTWSKREVTEGGSSLMDVVDHGLNRGKHASDCVGVILKEVKTQASDKRCRLMVAIDGVNGFWRESALRDELYKSIPSERISLIHHFKKLLADEWSNGCIIASVDTFAFKPQHRGHCTPVALLGKEGFELFDPFIPVKVDTYSEKEIYSALEYFADRHWIQHPAGHTEEGRKELIYKSGYNPYLLDRAVAPL
ncbi:small ribosomal subunit protein mS29-like [Liolophura sinensis]|uniref:small ribosomal subunit protein mS29-like n=1 Tax=Liolophura sinensis TaxID=3198878 RepID=UPI00315844F6